MIYREFFGIKPVNKMLLHSERQISHLYHIKLKSINIRSELDR